MQSTAPWDNQRNIVESIVEKVSIGKGEIDLTLSYLPSSDELVICRQELRTTCCPGHPEKSVVYYKMLILPPRLRRNENSGGDDKNTSHKEGPVERFIGVADGGPP